MNPMNNNNPMNIMMNFINGNGDPHRLAEQVLQQNPQIRQAMASLQNGSQGQSPKDIALRMAQERGIDPNQLMQLMRRIRG